MSSFSNLSFGNSKKPEIYPYLSQIERTQSILSKRKPKKPKPETQSRKRYKFIPSIRPRRSRKFHKTRKQNSHKYYRKGIYTEEFYLNEKDRILDEELESEIKRNKKNLEDYLQKKKFIKKKPVSRNSKKNQKISQKENLIKNYKRNVGNKKNGNLNDERKKIHSKNDLNDLDGLNRLDNLNSLSGAKINRKISEDKIENNCKFFYIIFS